MPICSYPGCKEFAIKGNVRCSAHVIRNAADRKAESVELKKMRAAEEVARKRKEEQDARNKVAQQKADSDAKRRALQDEVMRQHRQTWNAQIDHVVSEVLALRKLDPSANAGSNAVGNTAGGTNNPVALVMTSPTHGVSKGDILRSMAGFDNSDSGLFKFRRKGVLVHCS